MSAAGSLCTRRMTWIGAELSAVSPNGGWSLERRASGSDLCCCLWCSLVCSSVFLALPLPLSSHNLPTWLWVQIHFWFHTHMEGPACDALIFLSFFLCLLCSPKDRVTCTNQWRKLLLYSDKEQVWQMCFSMRRMGLFKKAMNSVLYGMDFTAIIFSLAGKIFVAFKNWTFQKAGCRENKTETTPTGFDFHERLLTADIFPWTLSATKTKLEKWLIWILK